MAEVTPWYAERYITSHVIRSLLSYIENKAGANHPEIEAFGLKNEELNDSEFRYKAPIYFQLMNLGEKLSEDPNFGFHYGQFAEANRWGLIGYILSVSDNLYEVMLTQQRLQALVGNIGCTIIHDHDSTKFVEWFTEGEPNRHLAEEALAGWISFGRRITEHAFSPIKVTFRHEAPSNIKEYEDFFACPVEFNQPMNAIEVPLSLFHLPLKKPDKALYQLLTQHAGALLSDRDDDNLRQQIKAYLIREMPRSVPSIENVAERFNTSVRTLQRRFGSWDTTYKQLIDETRREIALSYFDRGGRSLLEVTFMLGFSEQSAFQRAFKRWMGCSPKKYLAP